MMDVRLVSDIQLAEGLKLTAYKDTEGYWTIGYGHLLQQNIDWTGHVISQNVADNLLAQDINTATEGAESLPEWRALDTPCRQNCVIELVFNLGVKKWRYFAKCRFAIQQHTWQVAHDELINSMWAVEVGKARSHRLAEYLLEGQYP